MRKAASIMILLGKIFCGIKIFVEVAVLVLGPIILANKEKAFDIATNAGIEGIYSVEDVQSLAITMIIGAAIAIAVEIVLLCFAVKADKTFERNERKTWPYIVLIVLGALGNGIFYLLGGIFALVETEKSNAIQQTGN